ncbi:MAG TPA: hypothetical protein PKD92_11950, partial [Novosphingobium sp.]|nr:hypothetical protein [Novosphingobium sp.]
MGVEHGLERGTELTAAANPPKLGADWLARLWAGSLDRLIERIIFAKDRDELVAATRALDRVLLWGFYVVPQWHNPQ